MKHDAKLTTSAGKRKQDMSTDLFCRQFLFVGIDFKLRNAAPAWPCLRSVNALHVSKLVCLFVVPIMAPSFELTVEFTKELLQMYRNLPCLWQVKSTDYKNRNKREIAWKQLTEKVQEQCADVDVNCWQNSLIHWLSWMNKWRALHTEWCNMQAINGNM